MLKQALPKLRVAVDWFSDPARIEREAAGMRWLAELAPPQTIPRLIFEDRGHHLLAMEAVPEPHENWKAVLLAGRVEAQPVGQVAQLLGTVHRRAANAARGTGRGICPPGVLRVAPLEPYYAFTAARVPAATDFLQALIDATRRIGETLVHGDFSPKNILLCGPRMVLLDHEVIHWGDPAFDVGFFLDPFVEQGPPPGRAGGRPLPPRPVNSGKSTPRPWGRWTGRPAWSRGPCVTRWDVCWPGWPAVRRWSILTKRSGLCNRAAAVSLMQNPPSTIDDLIDSFLARL